ncbi:nuclear transport factor 2 family protein [Streptomyces sp. TG1A-8]|uniref:nuclear transport factor 2 family protein n=1 Tax=Streptomyces sp. TG1A-8 TaxID=3051385 RepID=UPI00265BE882|nr:nuclear transport factor 2 family protein [Streptomyces sp. TG1A-8]MDO0929679.1 nuclear transport factor 2 family protein [Streptomyces sp. TG1A-8]
MTTTDIENALSRLLDEAAIRDTVARFADAATRGDTDRFRATWAEDAEWTIGERVHAVGVDDIVSTFRKLRDERDFFVQFAVPGPIEIHGDEATTSIICHEAARGPGETYYRNHSVAVDRLRRSENGWVFTSRSFQYLWLDTSPFTGNAFKLPAGF